MCNYDLIILFQKMKFTENMSELRKNLLVDDCSKVWNFLLGARLTGQVDTSEDHPLPKSSSSSNSMMRQNSASSSTSSSHTIPSSLETSRATTSDITIDFILDNAGFELFSDLCFADFLISTGLATIVRIRVKVRILLIELYTFCMLNIIISIYENIIALLYISFLG